jgi:hypothetical protein
VANSPTGGNGAVGKIALSWVKLFVDDNDCYCPLLTDELLVNPPAASKVLSSFECELLGVPENSFAINVYPNPTHGFVNINVSSPVHFEVYSALGQRLLSGELTQNEQQIDFSNFQKGIYYVRVGNETLKIVRD